METIMGKGDHPWQSSQEVLGYFGKQLNASRRKYREFIRLGVAEGKRDDLTGGGLIRSTGGWTAVKELLESQTHIKSDERILGDGDFVSEILSQAEEPYKRRAALKAHGVDVQFIAKRVTVLLDHLRR